MEELKAVLSKPSLNEKDMKVISKHFHLLTDKDLVRLGYKNAPKAVEAPAPIVEDTVKPVKKVSKK